jgi:hypothetical protein
MCADSGNTVTELNENNNCGPWVGVSVSAAAPTCSTITAVSAVTGSTVVKLGDEVLVTWSCQNATSCDELSPAEGFETSSATGATDRTQPTVATASHAPYGIKCYGPSAPGGLDFYTNSFSVVAPTYNITATPLLVNQGNPSRIEATCSDAISASVTRNGVPIPACTYTGPGPISYSCVYDAPGGSAPGTYVLSCETTVGVLTPKQVTVSNKPIFGDF